MQPLSLLLIHSGVTSAPVWQTAVNLVILADSSIIGPIFRRDILETLSSTNQMKAFRADA